jgi:acyl transferase domain-containing protein/NAD(P)H-dependent flavin oxidoreductase YrpB (nitropropane dioxygenase family)
VSIASANDALDAMMLAGNDFAASISTLTPELLECLRRAAGRGLREIILCQTTALETAIPTLKSAGLIPLAQVCSEAEARAAVAAGAEALVIKGNESGGRVGEESTLVLLQRLSAITSLPLYARGGIGIHTAGACLVAGAVGVLLDWQLALALESDLPAHVKGRLARMDGSETAVLGQNTAARYRAYARPGETAFFELKAFEEQNLDSETDAGTVAEWRQAVEAQAAAGRLLLIGQDGAFAPRLASRYRTVAGICQAIKAEALRHVRLARVQNVIREGAPLAEAHGTRVPVLQGPMTRVSDRAPFAAAVAAGGGLPFLALALMRAPQVRTLLAETSQQLADRPWGVGILGFVPKELREEQLAEVLKVKPPFAIIAGGRPDQAKALEAEGIKTYLHVPSHELLRMFLESGARRVIFEGRECGGHVGPRNSFVLWELMVETLLGHLAGTKDPASDYHAIFAGGIHDARSAAMAATIAAPLVEKGVRVGVLLGTGYLFTVEAVSSGAIVDGFQQEALRCRDTILLETGVGHATRCATTEFGRQFLEQRRQMAQEGRSREEIRDVLEMLNLGRLRVASKGVVRESAADGSATYVSIADDQQRREGMYMIGQVAALRDQICTIQDLHDDVCRASLHLAATCDTIVQRQLDAVPNRRPGDIAIIGISCTFPKAANLQAFWQNVVNKVNAIEEVPKDRWDVDLYFNSDRRAPDKIYSRWGGFLGPVPFDPVRYGMPPNTVPSVEPLQLLMLELGSQALEDAGYGTRPFDRERTAIVVGVGGGVSDLGMGYGFRSLLPYYVSQAGGTTDQAAEVIANLEHCLPSWTEDSFAGLLLNVVAGRVANRLDLGGANYTVDAACATSLAALRLAMSELESRSSDMVVVAGADTMQSPFAYLCFSKTQALSPTGQCRTFDEAADGIVISEGVAVAVLKRFDDAVRDGDRIYAVLKSVGASSDGKDKGLTAPRPIGQMRALQRAYEKAEVSPETVDLIEAHGTGTVVGDRTEVESITRFFSAAGAARQSVALGSVKSLVGHSKCTAGLAGLVKATMGLYHKVLPPTGGITTPNSKADFPNTPFYLNTSSRPWLERGDGAPRRAGVSAFGFGGTNFHAVLEEAPAIEAVPSHAIRDWPAELFLWRGESREDVLRGVSQLGGALDSGAQPTLCEAAAAVCWEYHKATGACTLAIVADSLTDLKKKLIGATEALSKAGDSFRDPTGIYYAAAPVVGDAGAVAFLFPGQGSQRPEMLSDLAVAFSIVREAFEDADASLGLQLGQPLGRFIFPPPAFTDAERAARENAIKRTDVAQPAIGAADMAMHRLLTWLGIHADMAGGHSYGEFVALAAAGAIPADELIRLSEARGRFIIESPTDELGTMAAIDAGEAAVASGITGIDGVVVANVNSPQQTVISGTEAGVGEALKKFIASGMQGRKIPVACAFHSPLVAGAREPLFKALQAATVRTPLIPVYSNTTAAPHRANPDAIRSQLAEHLALPVRFADELTAMYDAGARVFIEVGPGRVLTGLVERSLAGRQVAAVAMDQPGRPGLVSLVHALAQLAVAGVDFLAYRLFDQRVGRHLEVARLVEMTRPSAPSPTTWTIANGRAIPGPVPQPKAQPEHPKPIVIGKGAAAPSPAAPSLPGPVPQAPAPVVSQAVSRTVAPAAPPVAAPIRTAPQPSAEFAAVMQGHHRLMSKMLQTHRSIMLQALGGQTGARPAPTIAEEAEARIARPAQAPVRISAPVPMSEPIPTPVVATMAPMPAAAQATREVVAVAATSPATVAPAPAGVSFDVVIEKLVALVSDRTGYPSDMLGLDLDLEADLGVDSIKRVEILSALGSESSMSVGSIEGEIEQLSKLKTLRAIAEWIVGRATPETAPAPAPGRPAAATVTTELVIERLVALVSDRTGYPAEMLGLDLDLEADLGVDSIKRVEILSALGTESSLAVGSLEGEIEQLSKLKTLRAIAEWITARAAGESSTSAPAPAPSAPVSTPAPLAAPAPAAAPRVEIDVARLVPELVEAPLPPRTALPAAGIVVVTDDGRQGAHVVSEFERAGVKAVLLGADAQLSSGAEAKRILQDVRSQSGPIAGLVHLRSLADSRSLAPREWPARLDVELNSLFTLLQVLESDLREGNAGRVIVGTRMGGGFGIDGADCWPGSGAVGGLLKSVAREWTSVACRVVDFEFDAPATDVARSIVDEFGAAEPLTEVGYRNGVRLTVQSVAAPLAEATAGLAVDKGSVVLVTGGARGITATIAAELAERYQCTLILAGRSALPKEAEPADTAGITDVKALKAVLRNRAQQAGQSIKPGAIEAAYRSLMQSRDMTSTLATLAAAGSRVEYHAVDVTNVPAFEAFIDDIYARHGRLDGVIHGAGVIEDKLLADKTPESFNRVVNPKLLGAIALVNRLRLDSLSFLVFFSSVSGRYGNRGQGDYAAANEVLTKLARKLQRQSPARVLSLNWGPWKTDNGMVSSALAAQFAKAGVQMIEPAVGRRIFAEELLRGRRDEADVIWGGPLFHTRGEARATVTQAPPASLDMPLLSGGATLQQNGSVLVVRDTDPQVDRFLLDHQLDATPVMPMAMALELFAEVAAVTNPGKQVAAVHDVKLLRGLPFHKGEPRQLRIKAANASTQEGPRFSLRLETDAQATEVHYTAMVELRDGSATQSPRVEPLVLKTPVAFPLSVPAAYATWLFHGPLFAGIARVDALGENGIIGELTPSRPAELFAYAPSGAWIVDPVIVDSALQLIILWSRHYLDSTPLPSRLGTCRTWAPLGAGPVKCEVEIQLKPGSATLVNDIRFYDADGRLCVHMVGMELNVSKALNRLAGAGTLTEDAR